MRIVVQLTLVIAALLCGGGSAAAQSEQLDINQVMRDFAMPANAAARIRNGEMVEADPDASSERELAVGLTFLTQQPMNMVFEAFKSATDMRANQQLLDALEIHGRVDDLGGLVLQPDGLAEAKRYQAAQPGDAFNLSADEIQLLHAQAAPGASPVVKVEQQLKQLLFERYADYQAKGFDGMKPYARGGGMRRPSDELRSASQAASLLTHYAPELWKLLLSYPHGKPPGLEEKFYLLRYNLDGRPNYVLRHRMALPFHGGIALVDRDFYVSRGYNISQAISGLFPVPEGTIVFFRNRVSTDQVGGFGSSMKQSIGRSVMAKQLVAIFEQSRASFSQNMSPVPLGTGSKLLH